MTNIQSTDWRGVCRAQGLDPAEVDMVFARYAAYRDYMSSRGGALTLADWFRFYRLEKASESGQQAGGLVGGCSADGEAMQQNLLSNPKGFLEVLRLRVASLPPR